ncbi:MAG TPA: cytidylate kinase-like family protein [Terriglobales bacterium]|nr:cytidylate kinase-like family protein [Terriglobales bacterium]
MYRIITVEREFGCGAGEIAEKLAHHLGWKLWDHALTEEIARRANVDCSTVERCDERVDSTLHRLARVFWRGSYERHSHLADTFDADCMVEMVQQVLQKAATEGNCVIVGRGAPYFLRERCDAFHVFLYAARSEKIRRLKAGGKAEAEAEEMVENVDRDRIAFVKRYYGADWPTRSLYHVMLNTAVGNDSVIETILNTMRTLENGPCISTPSQIETSVTNSSRR